MTQSTKPLIHPVKLDLKKLNQRFEKANPNAILAWCLENFPTGLVQVSTFNVDDMLITDLLYRELRPASPIPVLFLDTLHHFPETLELVARAQGLYNLSLQIYRIPTVNSREAFAKKYGKTLWETDLNKFHHLTKGEPLERGLAELKTIAWITGYRRDQSDAHANLPIFELDAQQRLKVNPLATWTRKETWAYVFEHDVIYNPLHDQGYASIGDEPITTAIAEGKATNAGGWRDTDKLECGIHF